MAKTAEAMAAKGGVQSVEIGVRVLLAVMTAGGPAALKTVCQGTGLSPSKVHRYLVSLIRSGLVEQDDATGKYGLGPTAVQVGMAAILGLNVVRSAVPVMAALREEMGVSVVLTVWGDHGPTVIHWEESQTPITVNLRIGSVMPILTTATGNAYLAWLPRPTTQRLVDEELPRWEDAPKIEIDKIIARAHKRGVTTLSMQDARSLAAIAAPIFGHDGKLAAVLTLFGYRGSFDNTVTGPNVPPLRRAAREISSRLGYDPDRLARQAV